MKSSKLFLLLLLLQLSVIAKNKSESPFPLINNWNLTVDEIVYEPNNLWDAINGAADLYLEYNFINLHIGTYINADKIEIKAELYRHKTEVDAFGIYSQERDPGYNFIKIGAQGYLQEGVLNFLTGSYYVKLSAYQTNNITQTALQKIAVEIDKHLNQTRQLPKILQYFPSGEKQLNSEQYIAKNFLGYNFFNNAYTASYRKEQPFKVFIIETKNEKEAKAALASFIKEQNEIVGDKTYEVTEPNTGIIAIRLFKHFICGILNCKSSDLRNKYLEQTIVNIQK